MRSLWATTSTPSGSTSFARSTKSRMSLASLARIWDSASVWDVAESTVVSRRRKASFRASFWRCAMLRRRKDIASVSASLGSTSI